MKYNLSPSSEHLFQEPIDCIMKKSIPDSQVLGLQQFYDTRWKNISEIDSPHVNRCLLEIFNGALLIVSLSLYFTPVGTDTMDRCMMRLSSLSELCLSLTLYLPSGNSISFISCASFFYCNQQQILGCNKTLDLCLLSFFFLRWQYKTIILLSLQAINQVGCLCNGIHDIEWHISVAS